MKDLLYNYYGIAYNSLVKHDVTSVECGEIKFEIKDKEDQIVCKKGNGISVFSNPRKKKITIIDFEDYINKWRGQAGQGKRCDFILYDDVDYVVLNELTTCQERFLDNHYRDGREVTGKRSHAICQIQESINKLCHVPEIDDYINKKPNKVGLFSYKIKEDANVANEVNNTMAQFRSVNRIYENVSSSNVFTKGFVFEQRIYPEAFNFK